MANDSLKPATTLKNEGLKEWNRICDELKSLGRLDSVDRAILSLHCNTWEINRDALKHVQSDGQIQTYSNGTVGPSTHYKNWCETTKILRGTLADMGLTPSSRSKLASSKVVEELEI
jgi:P27 family predicted phage terminase small subunit